MILINRYILYSRVVPESHAFLLNFTKNEIRITFTSQLYFDRNLTCATNHSANHSATNHSATNHSAELNGGGYKLHISVFNIKHAFIALRNKLFRCSINAGVISCWDYNSRQYVVYYPIDFIEKNISRIKNLYANYYKVL